MAIKIMSRSEIVQNKVDAELKQLKKAQDQLVKEIKTTIGYLVDLDYLHELQEYIEDCIIEWENEEFELEEDD